MIVPFSFWKPSAPPPPAPILQFLGLVASDFSSVGELEYYNNVEELRHFAGTVYGSQHLYFQVACLDAHFTGQIGLARRATGGSAQPEVTFPHHLTYDDPELMGYAEDAPYFLTNYRVRVYPVTWVTNASETWIVWAPEGAAFPVTSPDKYTFFEVYNNLPG